MELHFFFALDQPHGIYLSDINQNLVNTYQAIQKDPKSVIEKLKSLKNTKEGYYEVRSTKYDDIAEKAAQFIFLNQTSFNGLYRVNLQGEYNVPYGYRKKDFLDEDNLTWASIKQKNTSYRL